MTVLLSDLTPRQREIAELVGNGYGYEQIALALTTKDGTHPSVETVRVHVAGIADRIGRNGTRPYRQVMRWVIEQRTKAA